MYNNYNNSNTIITIIIVPFSISTDRDDVSKGPKILESNSVL